MRDSEKIATLECENAVLRGFLKSISEIIPWEYPEKQAMIMADRMRDLAIEALGPPR